MEQMNRSSRMLLAETLAIYRLREEERRKNEENIPMLTAIE
jgi:hypothetical protein